MNKKLLFFDIDMTLWDFYNNIPESTIDAIRTARKNGHLAFINSGRSRAFITNPKLFAIGFDGVVSGCGTMIEYHDKDIFYHRLDNEYVKHVVDTVRSHSFRPILEGRYHLYFDNEDFADDPYGKKLIKELGDNLRGLTEYWGQWEVSKLSCATPPNQHEECKKLLGDDFDFIVHDPEVVEMAPKGFSKGGGIKKICELLDFDINDTIAFGDSPNDITMLDAAGFSVVMGDGHDEAKEHADYVTSNLHDDGIQQAMSHLGLI